MPKFHKPLKSDVDVRFFCSAAIELVSSLHVISEPEHHTNCIAWYEKVKKELDSALLNRIENFGKKYTNWAFVMDLVDLIVDTEVEKRVILNDFDKVMDGIKQMDRSKFVYAFLGETLIGEKELIEPLIQRPEQDIEKISDEVFLFISKENAIDFLKNIDREKEEMVHIIETYYYTFFSKQWENISGVYYGKIISEKKVFEACEPIEYILSLHKDLVYVDNSIVMKKKTDMALSTDKIREVRLFFSMFTYPHFAANIYEDTMSIYKNLIMPANLGESGEIAYYMRAFSDINRLSIIKILTKQASTNKSLAQLLDVAPASISQHLNILKDLDLVTAVRDKNTINYYLNQEETKKKIYQLCEFLNINPESIHG